MSVSVLIDRDADEIRSATVAVVRGSVFNLVVSVDLNAGTSVEQRDSLHS
jgi:hypothetical protein